MEVDLNGLVEGKVVGNERESSLISMKVCIMSE